MSFKKLTIQTLNLLNALPRWVKEWFRAQLINFFSDLGFVNYKRHKIYGPRERLYWEYKGMPTTNSFFNTRSGRIYIGDGAVIGHNCMFLTGRHEFENGKLKMPKSEQVPTEGYDIKIGAGCWIASGVIIIGGVTLGDNCLVATGAVVTHNFPDGSMIAGVPAKCIGQTIDLDRKKQYQSNITPLDVG